MLLFGGISTMSLDRHRFELDDGSLLVDRRFFVPLMEEYSDRGRLTVAQAATLVERWQAEAKR